MKNRIGVLAGIPVLLFFGWFLWTEVLNQQNFPEWEQEILEGIQALSPEAVSEYRVGNIDNYPGFMYRLTPRTEEQRIREEQFWRNIRAEREELDTSRLSAAQLESYQAIRLTESIVLDLPWEWWAMNLFHPEYGIQNKLPLFLIHSHHIEDVDDAEGYLYRIRELPARLNEAIIETERVASMGWVMDSLLRKEAASQLRQWAATPVKQQEIYRSFGRKITRLDPTVINEYQELEYLIEVSDFIEDDLVPLLTKVAARLEHVGSENRTSLSSEQKILWASAMAGVKLDSEQIRKQLQPMLSEPPSVEIPEEDSLEIPVETTRIYNEIFNASAGILPAYPAQRIRLHRAPQEARGAVWKSIPGSFDQKVFPVLIVPDSVYTYQEWISVYQVGLPGVAWKRSLERESTKMNWTSIEVEEARMAGWGMASLDLLQEKLLWFSRDSMLLSAFETGKYRLTRLAAADLQNIFPSANHSCCSEEERRIVARHPGWYLAQWISWKQWKEELSGNNWKINH